MTSTTGWWRILVVVTAVGGCARDNPLFDDSATDGGTTAKDTDGPPTGPNPSSSDSASSLTSVGTEPVTTAVATEGELTSDSHAYTTTSGSSEESSAVSDTEACTTQTVDAMLDGDAFLVEGPKCTACADANYGATAEQGLYVDDTGQSYYVVHLRNFPALDTIEAVTLYTNIAMLAEGSNAMLEVLEFWPGCEWPEGTRNGPVGNPADGITFHMCDPLMDTPMPGGSPEEAIGAALADPLMLGEEVGLVSLEIPLDAGLVKTWLEAGGDSILLRVASSRNIVAKPAREAKDSGGLELAFDVCL